MAAVTSQRAEANLFHFAHTVSSDRLLDEEFLAFPVAHILGVFVRARASFWVSLWSRCSRSRTGRVSSIAQDNGAVAVIN